jgi:RNA polymerase sigma-70 factor (ECF subfamily)
MSHGAADGQPDHVEPCPPSVETLYKAHDRLAFAVAMSILRDHHLAEDAVQETFVRVARALDRGLDLEYPGPFIRTIARNEALRIAGRPRPGALAGEPAVSPPQEEVDDRDERRKIRETLDRMPPEQADLLSEIFFDGLSRTEVRRRLDLSGAGLFKRLVKAKETFRRRFRRPRGP